MLIHLCENCNSPERKSPPLSQQPSLKDEVLSSTPLFENLVGGSTPLLPVPPHCQQKREGGGVHTM